MHLGAEFRITGGKCGSYVVLDKGVVTVYFLGDVPNHAMAGMI